MFNELHYVFSASELYRFYVLLWRDIECVLHVFVLNIQLNDYNRLAFVVIAILQVLLEK